MVAGGDLGYLSSDFISMPWPVCCSTDTQMDTDAQRQAGRHIQGSSGVSVLFLCPYVLDVTSEKLSATPVSTIAHTSVVLFVRGGAQRPYLDPKIAQAYFPVGCYHDFKVGNIVCTENIAWLQSVC